ncbi:MAG TPA: hypothetical protein VKB63_12310 [Gemmatimonadales bacterium]|nr:hypothetical protein [Gemmatimonadales bacterium]
MHRSQSMGLSSLALVGALLLPRMAAAQNQTQVTVSGVSYAQYGYLLKDTANHVNTFDITRAYVNLIGRFAGGVGARVTLDVNRPAGDNSLRYRLKYAYATYTPVNSALTFKLGMIHTPWLDWEEALWDYRMQGQMALERGGYLTSSDIGFGVDGKWGPDKVNMQLTFVNGEGYSGGPGDQRKDVEGRVSVRLLDTSDSSRVGGLRLTGYGQYGKPTGGGKRQRFVGMLSYRSKQVTLAGEYAITKDSAGAGALLDGQVASGFGVFHFPNSKAAAIARVDFTKPNKNGVSTAPGFSTTRFIAGLSYQLSPNLRLLGDVDYLSYKNGSPSPAAEASRASALFQIQFTF